MGSSRLASLALSLLVFVPCSCDGGGKKNSEPGIVVPPGTFGRSHASEFLQGEADLWVLAVPEEALDLNGDGDTGDAIVHVYDASTGETTNLGLAAAGYPLPVCPTCRVAHGQTSPAPHELPVDLALPPFPVVAGHFMAFYVGEEQQGEDLSGDGDQEDQILFVYDAETRRLRSLGAASLGSGKGGVAMTERFLVFRSEGRRASDAGNVLVYDLELRRLSNLGVVSSSLPELLATERVGLNLSEAHHGDLNGDGDDSDAVFHVYDLAHSRLANSGLVATSVRPIEVDGVWIVATQERELGRGDLTGNGDELDVLWHAWDPDGGAAIDLGLFARTFDAYSVSNGTTAALAVDERSIQADLNDDGDAFDTIPHLVVPRSGFQVSTGVAVGWWPHAIALPGGFAFLVEEDEQGSDLDADGALTHLVLVGADEITGMTTSLGLPVRSARGAERLWFIVDERETRVDANGDGDLGDPVLYTWIPTSASATSAGFASIGVGDTLGSEAAFMVSEAAEREDLNGDGDERDVLVARHDAATGQTRLFPVRAAAFFLRPGGGLLALVRESQEGVDLNLDGDTDDVVFQHFATGTSHE